MTCTFAIVDQSQEDALAAAFYRDLLELGYKEEITPFIQAALEKIGELSGARLGYIELHDGKDRKEPAFSASYGVYEDEVDTIRGQLSSGVIQEALATGKTIATDSAHTDPKFLDKASVRRLRIEQILCAPLGKEKLCGVIYLQNRIGPGPFPERERARLELFAGILGLFAEHLLLRRKQARADDPTFALREKLRCANVIGRSAALAKVLKQVDLYAPLDDAGVLLTGENGTGKTAIAKVIHANSPRAAGPFVAVNSAAIPETLFESELFGALPGAATSITRKLEGKVAAAEGGTLFLDEIGEVSPSCQAKLLTLLNSKEYYPLGAASPSQADVRIIAATNRDLKAAVAARTFREDLFFRLKILSIRMPTLAERPEDIDLLACHLCDVLCDKRKQAPKKFSAGAMYALESHDWTGNIRELENVIQTGIAHVQNGSVIERRHLFPDEDVSEPEVSETFEEQTRRFHKSVVERMLDETNWNVSEAARRLGLSRAHTNNLINKFKISRPQSQR